MSKVTESIFSGEKHIIPMAEVQFIEKDKRDKFTDGISVILSGTTWNNEIDTYNNMAYLSGNEAQDFLRCWCKYRSELESDSLADISPSEEIFPDTREALDNITIQAK